MPMPTYDSIGVLASLILLLCRVAQGFSHARVE